jgi:valyl-tRNA synthetase
VDPLVLVDEYGADAVRFTLAILDSPGRDIPLDPDRMAGYRSFGNKIWNATRFSLSRVGESQVQTSLDPAGLEAPERWILSRLSRAAAEVNQKFATYRFDEACRRLYHFFWGELCDWYIELSKPALFGEAPRPEVGAVLLTVLDRSLRLLHPVMPFLTEELWQRLPGHEKIHPQTICLAPYPESVEAWEDAEIENRMDRFIALVSWARNVRSELEIPPKTEVELYLNSDDDELLEALARPLIRLSTISYSEPPPAAHRDIVAGVQVGLVIPEAELSEANRSRLTKEKESLQQQIERVRNLLDNEQFVSKAPDQVVEQNRGRLEDMQTRLQRIEADLG